MMGIRDQIVEIACEILRKDGGEIQLSVIKGLIIKRGFRQGTVKDALEKLLPKKPGIKRQKADNGEVFFSRSTGAPGRAADDARPRTDNVRRYKKVAEKDYYKSFAEFLVKRNECTKAASYGEKRDGGKWENPDVVGVYDPTRQRSVEFPAEIVTAEIKKVSDAESLITAFGQACSYLLFSHRVYLVAPRPNKHEEKRRIKSLCRLLGIGLVFFNPESGKVDASIYQMELRARSHLPEDAEKYASFVADDIPDPD